MIDRKDPLWYKDAVIYQLHIKAFFDANNDGIGDFAGLTEKLDYIQELGVTTLWILPFYPSPLRDDGYDIADYREVNPSYGSMQDFRRFLRECHDRNLRVITELVINHTSDQHRWFQRAREAKPGSAHRNYYVWSDTDQKYLGTRVIFCDTEKSNWTWDPVAQQYYWHRFYSHQPDLNFESKRVIREVLNAMRYWLDMGVDGLRLDAIPYLREREGTNNENLPETHEILKIIRAEVDKHYTDRMLLAEANQWPEDVLPYFGDPAKGGDECHMAFHFPVMPRIYMALAMEDRHPIADIMRQTPEIPENSQWAIFLRNHDELTLEMVTNDERDYLWNFYASDRRMRINLGIRRRLAPLLDNDRRKIELLNSLLLSMPGTPVVYYGDELGMGDNIYLGDRDGVRTPMQWSPDRNGGFSRADPARLYLPPIQDPIYGYQAVNVEAQARNPSSLLNWTRRLITVRQQYKAFGRGQFRLLYPGNRKVLAYLRTFEDGGQEEIILCVANLSRSAQAVELDLKQWKARVPVEMLGRTVFPPIGDLTYLLTLPAYGFYWFVLAAEAELPRWHETLPEPMPDLVTLVVGEGWSAPTASRSVREMEDAVLPAFLPGQRWFAAKSQTITGTRIANLGQLSGPGDGYLMARVEVSVSGEDEPQHYFLPLGMSWDPHATSPGWHLLPFTLAKVRRGPRPGALYDAAAEEGFVLALLRALREGREVSTSRGRVCFRPTSRLAELELPDPPEVRRVGVEQSNTSTLIGDQAMVKVLRRLSPGLHPELEMARFLTEVAGFANTPPLLGAAEHIADDGTPTALVVVQGFVRNQGDGWTTTVDYLERELDALRLGVEQTSDETEAGKPFGMYLQWAATLGQRTAEMHRALAMPGGGPDFDAEPVTSDDLAAWVKRARRQAESAFDGLSAALPRLSGDTLAEAEGLLARRREVLERLAEFVERPVDTVKIRVHGDYHLGQVLHAQNDFYIIDFEGEPARPLSERRAKRSPLIDVAGILRSFNYAAWTALFRVDEMAKETGVIGRVAEGARDWEARTVSAFLTAYRTTARGSAVWPEDESTARRLLALFLMEKALYEIAYEASNRPTWLGIPVKGVLGILDGAVLPEME